MEGIELGNAQELSIDSIYVQISQQCGKTVEEQLRAATGEQKIYFGTVIANIAPKWFERRTSVRAIIVIQS